MADPAYVYRPWPQELRDSLAEIHRRRWGAPDGHCTIYGHHVPLEYAEPIRFWAQWIAGREGTERAIEFVGTHKAEGYARFDRLRELYLASREASANRELIRRLNWEAIYGRN